MACIALKKLLQRMHRIAYRLKRHSDCTQSPCV